MSNLGDMIRSMRVIICLGIISVLGLVFVYSRSLFSAIYKRLASLFGNLFAYRIDTGHLLPRFLLFVGINIVFSLSIIPFLDISGRTAFFGGMNMVRMLVLYSIFTGIVVYLCFNKKKFRPVALAQIFSWFVVFDLGVLCLFLTKKGTEDKTQETVVAENCNEQDTLQKAKGCTVQIIGDVSIGSGFLIQPNFIVTNRHVVEDNKKLSAPFMSGSEKDLVLWNYSEVADLAILKIDKSDIIVCDWADSNKLSLAETLYSVGFPGDAGLGESSIGKGIYSRKALTSEGPEFIQTDAPINPGNSGGPLVSKCGIVGINTEKVPWNFGGEIPIAVEGIGYAISANYAKPIVEEMIKTGFEKKLPIKSIEEKQYTPKPDSSGGNSGGSSFSGYNQEMVSSWISARNWANDAISYWNNVDPGQYYDNTSKLSELKDSLSKMKVIIDRVVPKIEAQQPLSNEEGNLLTTFNSLQKQAIGLEGTLEGHNYSTGYYHYACSNSYCSRSSGRGKDSCSVSAGCYHNECRGTSCVRIESGGTSTCYSDYSCKHSVCRDGQCVEVEGGGANDCYIDSSCYHNECQGSSCVQVNSPGISTCYSDYSCQ